MRQFLISLAVLAIIASPAMAVAVRITSSTRDDMGPVWRPVGGSSTIAYVREDSAGKWQIGSIQSNGSNEVTLASGPGSGYYGLAFSLDWVGSSGNIVTCERYSYHEYLSYDSSVTPFTRTASNGSDAAFSGLLVMPAGYGGDLIRVSPSNTAGGDGSPLVLWRSRNGSNQVQLRVASYDSLIGQYSNGPGTVILTGSGSVGIRGLALSPNGQQYLISLPSGAGGGWDIFRGNTDGTGGLTQLTFSGQNSDTDNYVNDIALNSTSVLFQSGVEGVTGSFDLYMMDINGNNVANLTNTAGIDDVNGTWAPNSTDFAFNRLDNDDGVDNWNIYVSTIPEPATLSLLAVGLGALVLRRRRKVLG